MRQSAARRLGDLGGPSWVGMRWLIPSLAPFYLKMGRPSIDPAAPPSSVMNSRRL